MHQILGPVAGRVNAAYASYAITPGTKLHSRHANPPINLIFDDGFFSGFTHCMVNARNPNGGPLRAEAYVRSGHLLRDEGPRQPPGAAWVAAITKGRKRNARI